MSEISKVGRRGSVVIPAVLRRQFGINEGSLMIAEARAEGILIRPAVALPAAEYRRQILDQITADYAALRADPIAWQQELEERQGLEGTLLDGLDLNEIWTEDGAVSPFH